MRSYNSLNSRVKNTSIKNSNIVSNILQTQYLGNTSSVSSNNNSGNIDLSNYALKTYVDSSINTVYANFADGTSSYTKAYIDASFDTVIVQDTSKDVSLNGKLFTKGDVSFNSNLSVGQSLVVNNRALFMSDVSLNSNTKLGSGRNLIAINKDVSLNFALDVSGNMRVTSGGILTTGTIVGVSTSSATSIFGTSTANITFGGVIGSSNTITIANSASSGNVNINGNIKLGPGSKYITVNKDISSAFIFDVSGDSMLRNKLFVTSDASFGSNVFIVSDLSLGGALKVFNDVSMNRNVDIGSGNNSVSINKDISSNFALDVSGITNLRSALYTQSDVSINGGLYAAKNALLQKTFFGYDPIPIGLPYEVDISGQMRIYELVGSNVTTSSSIGTLTLEHGDASGCSSILFKSPSTTSNGDYAYIKYQDLSGTINNAGLLTIGVENDPTAAATADKISLYAASGSGFVGVNTLNPSFNLDVSGNMNVSSTLTTNTINTTTTTSNFNLGTTVAGTLSTNGLINIGQQSSTASAGTINIGIGSGQTGAINIGSGASTKNITIGNPLGGNTIIQGSNISLNGGASGTFNLFSASTTGGSITIGTASGNQTLTIQRPIRLVSGSDPGNVNVAIGYIMPNVTSSSIAIAVPVNTYTWSTGLMTLGVGVWMVSCYAQFISAALVTSFNYNMGFMSSAPTTGDSATASKAPTNTISGVNGNIRYDDNTNITNGTYAYQVSGVILNNYGGLYNSLYGIFNADWSTSGTVTMSAFTLRAVRIA
jgi:hypothetical protein